MGKKKAKDAYNDFLDGEKLSDNAEIRTILPVPSPLSAATTLTRTGDLSPPSMPGDRGERGRRSGNSSSTKSKRAQLTHFVCLPLVNEKSRTQLEKSLGAFAKHVERTGVVPVRAIRPVGTLHLTLGVMALDTQGLEGAVRCLKDLDLRRMVQNTRTGSSWQERRKKDAETAEEEMQPLVVDLKSLVPMQQPHKTSILYAEPSDSTSRLYLFASALRQCFMDKGFVIEDNRALKLHATIANTIYARPKGRKGWSGGPNVARKTAGWGDDAVEEDGNKSASIQGSVQNEDVQRELEVDAAPPESLMANPVTNISLQDAYVTKGRGANEKNWMRFDATELISTYRDFLWAEEVGIDRVQICKMGARKIMDEQGTLVDEEYAVVAEKTI